jgi:hypothetical protein
METGRISDGGSPPGFGVSESAKSQHSQSWNAVLPSSRFTPERPAKPQQRNDFFSLIFNDLRASSLEVADHFDPFASKFPLGVPDSASRPNPESATCCDPIILLAP